MASKAVLLDVRNHLAEVRVDPKLPLDSYILEKVDGYITGMQTSQTALLEVEQWLTLSFFGRDYSGE